jgi:RNA polymerase sigma-70 factor, ECF subfamily
VLRPVSVGRSLQLPPLELRLAAGANMQPAVAHYLRRPGESEYRPVALDVLRIERGRVAEITSFVFPELFPMFGLPPTL